jgi:hypothetical protein
VKAASSKWVAQVGSWSLTARACLLILIALLALAAVTPFALTWQGTHGVMVSIIAMGVCLTGMLGALIAGEWLAGEKLALVNMGVGMTLRMGIPLGTCLVVQGMGGPLAEGGFAANLLVYYPLLLVAETFLTVARLQHVKR